MFRANDSIHRTAIDGHEGESAAMLCELAQHFPPFVESFLERGGKLRRRFREESVTDLLMNGLLALGAGRVIVEFPDEPVTGADMEWNFVNPDDNTFFRVLLQAKQAYGQGKFWKRHTYKHLLDTSGSSTTLQAVQLCHTARTGGACYPLYIFYNPARTCMMARRDGVFRVAGVSLADGYQIEKLTLASTTRKLRTRNKSIGRIERLLFPLSTLFCPPTILPLGPMAFAPPAFALPVYLGQGADGLVLGRQIPPTPDMVRERLVNMRPRHVGSRVPDLPEVPKVADRIPAEVRRTMELSGRTAHETEGLRHWRVTFVSESQPDFEAELRRMRRE